MKHFDFKCLLSGRLNSAVSLLSLTVFLLFPSLSTSFSPSFFLSLLPSLSITWYFTMYKVIFILCHCNASGPVFSCLNCYWRLLTALLPPLTAPTNPTIATPQYSSSQYTQIDLSNTNLLRASFCWKCWHGPAPHLGYLSDSFTRHLDLSLTWPLLTFMALLPVLLHVHVARYTQASHTPLLAVWCPSSLPRILSSLDFQFGLANSHLLFKA